MGFRFSIEHANWVAHLLSDSGSLPPLENDDDAHDTLRHLLRTFDRRLYSSRSMRREAEYAAREALRELEDRRDFPAAALRRLRTFFGGYPWVSLIVPSGGDREMDHFLTSPELLERLVYIRPDDPGLILQLERVPDRVLSLGYVFPAFKVALAESTNWPGVLTWTPGGDAAFFPIPDHVGESLAPLEWLFSHLARAVGVDLGLLRSLYHREIGGHRHAGPKRLHLVHLSDLHLGSKVASRRLPRVEQVVRSVIAEIGEDEPAVPVLTGDLMDTPDDSNLDALRAFLSFLRNLGVEDPLVVLGNHDVRKDGWLSSDYKNALQVRTETIRWIDAAETGVVSFDSVRGGSLARGSIGERQMIDVGNLLDQEPEKRDSFALIGLLHHHPTPVDRPNWYHRAFYERLVGSRFEKTEELEDAEQFLAWARNRSFTAVLHGHKHIPRVHTEDGLIIIGCGSSVGKVKTADPRRTYMSLNVVTVDAREGKLSCHLRAERIPGAGLEAQESHEVLFRDLIRSGVSA